MICRGFRFLALGELSICDRPVPTSVRQSIFAELGGLNESKIRISFHGIPILPFQRSPLDVVMFEATSSLLILFRFRMLSYRTLFDLARVLPDETTRSYGCV
jgi:hypothetical protein